MISDKSACQDLLWYFTKYPEQIYPVETKLGTCFAYQLKQSQLSELLKNEKINNLFCDLAMEGFAHNEISDEFHSDIKLHLFDCDMMYFVMHEDRTRLAAFLTHSTYGNILYFGGIMVYPDLQNNGYGSSLMRLAVSKNKPAYVSLRTQNPQMYMSIRKIINIFPNGELPTEEIKETAISLADKLKMSRFNVSTFTEQGTYGHSLYGKELKANGYAVDVFKNIDFNRGDSMLVIGKRRSVWN